MRNHGGVHAEYRKNTSQAKEVILPTPAKVSIPMRMHIGAPCVPTVSVGEIVEVGQLIADSKAAVSAPIHASVSGKVKAIKEVPSPADGSLMQVI
ncbi:MAG: electron transport complex subunit RsxC, partial [Clostridia bacterium]|nr:electron transport complex subunit RsxC [Clostridia bacterium]